MPTAARLEARGKDKSTLRSDGLPTVEVGGGLRLGAIDGTVTRMPDTAANRADEERGFDRPRSFRNDTVYDTKTAATDVLQAGRCDSLPNCRCW